MKLLTLNSHSLQEKHYPQKLESFVEVIIKERPDLLALQEVNQTMFAPPAAAAALRGYVPVPGSQVPIRQDNHAVQAVKYLGAAGIPCSWTWLPIKCGYLRYDEGLALISLGSPISQVDAFQVSKCSGYFNWRVRKVLGARLEGASDWFYSVHLGWWSDGREPFLQQWTALEQKLAQKKQMAPIWLLGDFNAPAELRGEGYDCIAAAGWQDTYLLAARREGRATVRGSIDGWRTRPEARSGVRIDQIWCSEPPPIASSSVLFDGGATPVVSDHFGVMVETGMTK